jgi:hypothetical protein
MRTGFDRRIRVGIVGTFAALALVLSACGIPVGGAPSLIDQANVPHDLKVIPTFPKAVKCTKTEHVIDVWFFRAGRSPSNSYLVPAPRCVAPATGKPAAREQAEVEKSLDNLLTGPTGGEHRKGFWSALESVPTSSITSTVIKGSTLTLRVDGSWQALPDVTGATAQVVWTVTSIDSKLVVQFLTQCAYSAPGATCNRNGIGPLLIYDPAGNQILGPASRSDYASLYNPVSSNSG